MTTMTEKDYLKNYIAYLNQKIMQNDCNRAVSLAKYDITKECLLNQKDESEARLRDLEETK